jgi:hypothetical protein
MINQTINKTHNNQTKTISPMKMIKFQVNNLTHHWRLKIMLSSKCSLDKEEAPK